MAQVGNCDDQPEIVTATMEMVRSYPDLHRTLTKRSNAFVRTELSRLARQATDAGYAPLSEVDLDVFGETVIALLAHEGTGWGVGPARTAHQAR